ECYLGEDASGGPVQYGECGDDICDSGENTPSYPYYCPQDCKQECKQDSDCSQPDCGEETDCVGIEQYKCVNGKCVSGTTEPALVCKNSCPLDGKCYPFGYRKGGKFCSDEGNFVEQGKSGACDNNFECASNVCVNSECISEGFLQKIMNWFRKMFGG
ncbi:MAG: hypothetical protein ABH840_01385, partial [Nanoarchaeota archaeon]